MEELFLPYQYALELKELGFDEDCFGKYEGKLNSYGNKPLVLAFTFTNLPSAENKVDYSNYPYRDIEAPTYQQVFKWFRQKHNLHGYVEPIQDEETVVFTYNILNTEQSVETIYETYEEAELELLNELIETIKNK